MNPEGQPKRLNLEINTKDANINKAFSLARELHKDQVRKSGEPYLTHCIAVYEIMKNEWGVENEDLLIASILHDVVEDTVYTIDQIKNDFGQNVAELVDGVTKLDSDNNRDTLKKVAIKTDLNPGVAIIKLADRLHNMRTLEHMSKEKQISKSQETVDVYARLAESLGMWTVKTELEDLCFKYLDNKKFTKTKESIDNDLRNNELFIINFQSHLEQMLKENNLNGIVDIRKNAYWALKEKQERYAIKGKSTLDNFSEINDVVSFRIKLDSISDCYQTIKEIHEKYGKYVDFDRYDEFIGANKRINGYEALQTTIKTNSGAVEVAVMTKEMEEFNNNGVLSLIKKDNVDLKDYVLKMIFTPTGSVRFLPKVATGVDFAAIINKRVLADAILMEVDGVIKPLSMVVPNGSTVNILFGDKYRRAPLPDLENYCMPGTRKIIEEQRRQETRDEFIKKGKVELENILSPRGILVITDLEETINPLLYKLGCQGADDLHFMVGSGSIKEETLNKEFDDAGITKEKLKYTTIRLIGIDQPGILKDITATIESIDKSIYRIDQKNLDNKYNIRIMIRELSKEQEEFVRNSISNDKRFIESVVV